MRRTFILHASGSKLPSDLLGLTSVRYGEATTSAEMRAVNLKLRKAIERRERAELIAERLRHWKSFHPFVHGTTHVGAVSPRKADQLHDEATGGRHPKGGKAS